MVSKCEWLKCTEPATHTVAIAFPGAAAETWLVCRTHDRALKLQVVRSRSKPDPKPKEPAVIQVFCGGCDEPSNQASDLPTSQRKPCPACGSLSRRIKVSISETLEFHGSLQVRSKSAGKGGWMVKVRTGDDYTRDLEVWGKRGLTADRARNIYKEVIELFDGTTLRSSAKLSDHKD
jgi:hypothetical protein